ncbi:hypothetical protein SSCG_06200 [Streptomyces clavuligerus]|nr:hypothetical protein SSCG_06200 [Streptomyces clavuligerus]
MPQERLPAQAEPAAPGRALTGFERISVRSRKPKHPIASALVIFSLWAITLGIIASGIARELEALHLPA